MPRPPLLPDADVQAIAAMKNIYPGFYPPTDDELKALWADALFGFDANVLLNLYRYSTDTTNDFLTALEKVKDRCWLCHQVGLEYHRNRITVIESQERSYESILSKLSACDSDLGNKRNHPYLSDTTRKKLQDVSAEIKTEFQPQKEALAKLKGNDSIRDRLSALFEGRIGDRFDDARLQEIYDVGERRFASHIPPGFEDAKTKAEPARMYGDLVLWFQLMADAKNQGRPLVFVSDDSKKDWWDTELKAPPCPRPELVEEFQRETSKRFFMYKPQDFLVELQKRHQAQVKEAAIKEVKAMGQYERANHALTAILEWQDGNRQLSPEAVKALLAEQERLILNEAGSRIAQLGRLAGILEKVAPEAIVEAKQGEEAPAEK